MIEITKTKQLNKALNSFNYTDYQVFFRIYNTDKTRYYNGYFIINYDDNDISEYFYNEDKKEYKNITKQDIKNFRNVLIDSFINSYDTTYNNHNEFFDACNKTIDRYNESLKNTLKLY